MGRNLNCCFLHACDSASTTTGSAIRRSIRIHQIGVNSNSAFFGYRLTGIFGRFHHRIPALKLGIANIDLMTNLAGNTVDCSGKTRKFQPSRPYRSLHWFSPRSLSPESTRGRAQSVVAIRHEHSARVSAGSIDRDFQARGRCNAGNHSKRNLLPLQQRPCSICNSTNAL